MSDNIYDTLIHDDKYWVKNPGKIPYIQRNVLLELYAMKLYSPAKVLDAGCGRGDMAKHLHESGYDVAACDFADALKYIPSEIPFYEVNLIDMPFTANRFDAVICVDVLEHLEADDAKKAIAELLRVGKTLIAQVACYPSKHGGSGPLHLTVPPANTRCMLPLQEVFGLLVVQNGQA